MKFKRKVPNIYVATDHPHFHFHLYYVIALLLLFGIISMFGPATETWKPNETSRMIGLIFLILGIMTTLYWLISYFAYKNIYFFNLDKAKFNWEKRRWFKKEGGSAYVAQCFLLVDVDSYEFNDIILQINKEKIYVTSGDGKLKKRFYDWFWDCIKTAKNLHHPTELIDWEEASEERLTDDKNFSEIFQQKCLLEPKLWDELTQKIAKLTPQNVTDWFKSHDGAFGPREAWEYRENGYQPFCSVLKGGLNVSERVFCMKGLNKKANLYEKHGALAIEFWESNSQLNSVHVVLRITNELYLLWEPWQK